MIRKALTILSLIGLLLSVGAWGVSYLRIAYRTPEYQIETVVGGLQYIYGSEDWINNRSKSGWYCDGFRDVTTAWLPEYVNFGNVWWIYFPLWIPSVLFGVLLGFSYMPRHRRRKRKKLGQCLHCGYDLRASKDRCPECGTEFVSTNVEG